MVYKRALGEVGKSELAPSVTDLVDGVLFSGSPRRALQPRTVADIGMAHDTLLGYYSGGRLGLASDSLLRDWSRWPFCGKALFGTSVLRI